MLPNSVQITWLKRGLFILCLAPVISIVWRGSQGGLGANPIETLTRASGDWTLYFLCFTLCITPLRQVTGQAWLIKFRRMLGVYCFFYASLHFTTFIWFDHFFDLAAMWKDVLKRPFITVGFSAFILLWPLALTSTQGMIRRLGRQWQRLHRVVYVIALLAIVHFWWMRAGKNNFAEPILFGSIILFLLAWRVLQYWRKRSLTTAA